jgi:hypothetical protein
MTTLYSDDASDTDLAAEKSVFGADAPRESNSAANDARIHGAESSAAADDEIREGEGQATDEEAKKAFDLRALIKQHPIAAGVVAVGAIGVGVIGYRWVRHSLPVRLYLALRFGRFRELVRV